MGSLKQAPVLVVEMPAPKLDAERAAILGETQNLTRPLDPSPLLSTTLERMAENKTAMQEPKDESINEKDSHASVEQHKPDVAPEDPGNTSACADKVLVHGAMGFEQDCFGVYKKTAIIPS